MEQVYNFDKFVGIWTKIISKMVIIISLFVLLLSLCSCGEQKITRDNVNKVGSDGFTPLMRGAWKSDIDSMVALLELGADINLRTEDGYSALAYAAYSNRSNKDNTNAIKFLLEKDAVAGGENGWKALCGSAIYHNIDSIELLLKYNAPLNYVPTGLNQWKKTVLMYSMGRDDYSTKITTLLVERGADVNLRTADGFAPIVYAAQYGNIATMKFLLEKGALIKQCDIDEVKRLFKEGFTDLKDGQTNYISQGIQDEAIKLLERVMDHQRAISILINSEEVTTNQIGEGGETSECSLAFTKLFEAPDHKEIFLDIFKKSKTINGKVYALIAMYSIDRNIYDELKKDFKGTEMISTFWYCEKTEYPINEIFKEIESNDLLHKVLILPESL